MRLESSPGPLMTFSWMHVVEKGDGRVELVIYGEGGVDLDLLNFAV